MLIRDSNLESKESEQSHFAIFVNHYINTKFPKHAWSEKYDWREVCNCDRTESCYVKKHMSLK
jgi:hypothetical protein